MPVYDRLTIELDINDLVLITPEDFHPPSPQGEQWANSAQEATGESGNERGMNNCERYADVVEALPISVSAANK